MAKKIHVTPMLDKLENGPWPSFMSITGVELATPLTPQPIFDFNEVAA